jgi:hypothetical protein
MTMLRVALAVGAVFIGAIAVFIGAILITTAVQTGQIMLSYGEGASAVAETVRQTAEPARFWRLVAGLGALPMAVGLIAVRWGWRTLSPKST